MTSSGVFHSATWFIGFHLASEWMMGLFHSRSLLKRRASLRRIAPEFPDVSCDLQTTVVSHL